MSEGVFLLDLGNHAISFLRIVSVRRSLPKLVREVVEIVHAAFFVVIVHHAEHSLISFRRWHGGGRRCSGVCS